MKSIKRNKPQKSVPDGYSLHVRVGSVNHHVFRHCSSDQRIWHAQRDGLVENANFAYSYDDVELHEILVNSLFPWEEIPLVTKFLREELGVAFDAQLQEFPLPLPSSYISLDFSDDNNDPLVITVGNTDAQLPIQICVFLFDTVGIYDEIWVENGFGDYFTARDRFHLRSFVLESDKDKTPFDFSIYGYEEPKGVCLFDQLRGVHYKIESYRATEAKEASDE